MTPFTVAARLHIPVVDADGMGRAFPEIQMVTPTLYGITASPMAIADEKGNASIVDAVDNRWTERLARTICIEMGTTAMIALYPMTGRQLKESMVPGTLTRAERVGRHIRQARQQHQNPIDALREVTGGFELFRGKVTDVQRVAILGIPCDPKWRTAGGLALVGPRCFNYEVDYVPVEERFAEPHAPAFR